MLYKQGTVLYLCITGFGIDHRQCIEDEEDLDLAKTLLDAAFNRLKEDKNKELSNDAQ